MKKHISALLFLLITSHTLLAQSNNPLEEFFFASGKIRVVIAVATIVLCGFLVYVFLLDRKVKRLEERIKNKK